LIYNKVAINTKKLEEKWNLFS